MYACSRALGVPSVPKDRFDALPTATSPRRDGLFVLVDDIPSVGQIVRIVG
jgi:hypothetical protein